MSVLAAELGHSSYPQLGDVHHGVGRLLDHGAQRLVADGGLGLPPAARLTGAASEP